jgi:hypothetical protein
MNRTQNFKYVPKLSHEEVSRKTAIHEAGHAAAIYLGNRKKGLPQVYFQIFIYPLNNGLQAADFLSKPYEKYIAKIGGGRLIHTLPSSLDEGTKGFSDECRVAYERAFEADIVNFLIGPLAEAKYVALRDGEIINPRLVNINALQNYGGLSDLGIVSQYFECMNETAERKERKISDLYLEAFSFISDRSNWLAITELADYILMVDKNIIKSDEIFAVLESNISNNRINRF